MILILPIYNIGVAVRTLRKTFFFKDIPAVFKNKLNSNKSTKHRSSTCHHFEVQAVV